MGNVTICDGCGEKSPHKPIIINISQYRCWFWNIGSTYHEKELILCKKCFRENIAKNVDKKKLIHFDYEKE